MSIERLTNPKHGEVRSIRFPYYESEALEWADRLAAYEDTNLTPADIADLARAKEEGRLVVLPLEVGDTVYKLATKLNSEDPIIIPIQVDDMAMFGWQCDKHDAYPFTFMLGSIGKTVFLTEQSAREELERRKGG